MITLKFPALHNALLKKTQDLNDDDPRKGIIVIGEHAIVVNDNFLLVCNLKDYFQIEEGIEDELEVKELDKILFNMDGKMFSAEFWKELTSGSNMQIEQGSIFIQNLKYSKNLHHKEVSVNLIEPLSQLRGIRKQSVNMLSCVALPFGALNNVFSVLKTEFKLDNIIFEFTGQDMPVKFTFRNRKHFYGCIMPHYDAAQEGFKFEDLDIFVSEYNDQLDELLEEAKAEAIAPAPPFKDVDKKQEPVDPAQMKLVD